MNSYGNPPNDSIDNSGTNFGGERRRQHESGVGQNQGGQGYQDQGFQGGGQDYQDPSQQAFQGGGQGYQDPSLQGQQGWQGDQGQVQGGQWSASAGENYDNNASQGNTTDQYTPGTGTQGGQDLGRSGYNQPNQSANAGGAGGKPSLGQRLKGDLQEMTGKATRNPGMAERGQQEKSGW